MIAHTGAYMQCRGEWKLARVVPGGDAYVVASPPGIPQCMYCGRPSSRPYRYAAGCAVICNVLLIMAHTCSVGASGSSPALCTPMTYMLGDIPLRGYIAFPHGLCFGRPSSRPYSYAMERCGDLQGVIKDCPYSCAVGYWRDFQRIINDCPYMQCRGEWKLARVEHAVAAVHVGWHPRRG